MNEEFRAITKNQRSLDSAVMMSSLMPSEKYSCSASPLMLTNGSTATAGRSGNGKAGHDRSRTSPGGPMACAGSRPFDLALHSADEPEALARNGADQLLVLAAVADRLSHSVDAAGQRRIRNDPAAPDRSDEIVLADDPVAVLHQINQEIEYLRLNGNPFGAAAQFAPVRVKRMI